MEIDKFLQPFTSRFLFVLRTGIFYFGFFTSLNCFSQNDNDSAYGAITFGVLQGGGSLFGADLEIKIWEPFCIQVGGGIFGFGGALNLHFKPTVVSSFVSVSYWHQGIGDYFVQSLIGTTFVFRARKTWTLQFGVGFLQEEGPFANKIYDNGAPLAILLYSAGFYLPLRRKQYREND